MTMTQRVLDRSRLASYGHLAFVGLVLASFPVLVQISGLARALTFAASPVEHSQHVRNFLVFLIAYLWLAFLCVAWGVKRETGSVLAPVMGSGKAAPWWKHGLAASVSFASLLVVSVLSNAFIAHIQPPRASVSGLTISSSKDAALFVVAAVSAGFVEEYVFRGYLQQQLQALTGSIFFASVLQVGAFTLGHLYQGPLRLVSVAALGAVLTITALMRRSVVPGMFAHAIGDGLTALAYWFHGP